MNLTNYFQAIGDSLTQLLNALLGSCNANESTSAKAAIVTVLDKEENLFWNSMYTLINRIFFWQKNHCVEAYLKDLERAEVLIADSQKYSLDLISEFIKEGSSVD